MLVLVPVEMMLDARESGMLLASTWKLGAEACGVGSEARLGGRRSSKSGDGTRAGTDIV